jgi:hypothetical protein
MLILKKYLHSHFQVSEKDWSIITKYFEKLPLAKNEYFVRDGQLKIIFSLLRIEEIVRRNI